MSIRAEAPGLPPMEFPDGTDQAVIDKTIKRELATKTARDKPTAENWETRKAADRASMGQFASRTGKAAGKALTAVSNVPGELWEGMKHPIDYYSRMAGKAADVGTTAIAAVEDLPGTAKKLREFIDNFDVGQAGDLAGTAIVGGAVGKAAGAAAEMVAPTEATLAKRALEEHQRTLPETARNHKFAATNAGLPASDEFGHTTPGNDLESTTVKVGRGTYASVRDARKASADPLYTRFNARMQDLEAHGRDFPIETPGADLLVELGGIETGEGEVSTAFTPEERALAKEARTALSGYDPENPAKFPVTGEVVDRILRKYRAMQAGAGETGFNKVVSDRARGIADRIEGALRSWVGEDYYPKQHYKDLSAEIDQWGTPLGRALAGHKDIEYLLDVESPGEFQQVTNKLFSSMANVTEGIGLLGQDQMLKLAERYVSNNFRFKNAEAARTWLDRNLWISKFPKLEQSVWDYHKELAARERSAAELKKNAEKRKNLAKHAAQGAATAVAGGAGYETGKKLGLW